MINREWRRMKIGQADRLGKLVVALGMIGIRTRYATKDRKNAVKQERLDQPPRMCDMIELFYSPYAFCFKCRI